MMNKIWTLFWVAKGEKPKVRESAKHSRTDDEHCNDLPIMGENTLGICESDDVKGKRIMIREDQTLEALLDCFIHENTHAASPDMASEYWVSQFSTDLTKNILRVFTVTRKA